MGEGKSGGRQTPPMHSQVNWSLLGLVIKRPSYAYELAKRFERTYDGVLSLSSVSHIYTALASLKDRSLIERVPGTGSEAQRKPIYKATAHGIEEYRGWLLGQLGEDRRRQQTVEANGGLVARLLDEEQGLVLDAKLTWARYAQQELEAFFHAT
jgi:DNA-binding PadR family transcriptional regulator